MAPALPPAGGPETIHLDEADRFDGSEGDLDAVLDLPKEGKHVPRDADAPPGEADELDGGEDQKEGDQGESDDKRDEDVILEKGQIQDDPRDDEQGEGLLDDGTQWEREIAVH